MDIEAQHHTLLSESNPGHETSQERLPQVDDGLEAGAACLHSEDYGNRNIAARLGSAIHKADRHSSILERTDLAGNNIGETLRFSLGRLHEGSSRLKERDQAV